MQPRRLEFVPHGQGIVTGENVACYACHSTNYPHRREGRYILAPVHARTPNLLRSDTVHDAWNRGSEWNQAYLKRRAQSRQGCNCQRMQVQCYLLLTKLLNRTTVTSYDNRDAIQLLPLIRPTLSSPDFGPVMPIRWSLV